VTPPRAVFPAIPISTTNLPSLAAIALGLGPSPFASFVCQRPVLGAKLRGRTDRDTPPVYRCAGALAEIGLTVFYPLVLR
jgi:hypothetical protein